MVSALIYGTENVNTFLGTLLNQGNCGEVCGAPALSPRGRSLGTA